MGALAHDSLTSSINHYSPRAAWLAASLCCASIVNGQTRPADGRQLEEVIVTAQKRSELLQDVPVPITAVTTEALLKTNQLRIQDYYTRLPGLSVMPGEGGSLAGLPKLTIRGITTGGFLIPTVGVTVDDVPYGSSKSVGLTAPDIDPSDLSRVEVLRGPQGALYGASSMGGLFKFVTVDPSTAALSGRLQAGISTVRNGDEPAYNVRGAINVPLGDTFAIRASAFTRQDAGYIDDPILGAEGVNSGEGEGGRVSALWQPFEDFSVKLSALMQEVSTEGSSFVHEQPGLGEFEQSAARGTGGYDRESQAYSATVDARLGSVNLTSVSGYNTDEFANSLDFTSIFGGFAEGVYGVNGAYFLEQAKTDKFSQEIRFSVPFGQTLEWLFGTFYTREKTHYNWDLFATDPLVGGPAGLLGQSIGPSEFTEYAAFTTLTFHITERFDLQVGARQSHDEQEFTTTTMGALFPNGGSFDSGLTTEEDAFTYLLTPKFNLSDDLMLYARLASGFRAGGSNPNPFGFSGVPRQFDPDETRSYEIGFKGSLAGRSLTFDASLYYIDWRDIQVNLFVPNTTVAYTTNGGEAKSQGVELAIESSPLDGLRLAAWASWNEAELTEDFPETSTAAGASGDRLPYSGRVSGSLSADQEFVLTSGMNAFVGASLSYVGDRRGVFTATGQRQDYPSYAQTDVRAGVQLDKWSLNLFVNNVTDKRVIVSGGAGSIFPFAFIYLQPRTAGVSLTKTF